MKKQFFSLALFAVAWLACGSAQAWDEPAQVDGVYQIGTASELEWYAEYVNSCVDGDNAGNTAKLNSKAVLTADIDLTGITHTPIGKNTTFKFDGEFNGQHHRIKNMIINNTLENQGFFGCVRGNAIIKNIIIDKSCSITAGNRAAGLIGTLQTAADGKCRILNCVNEANVTSVSGVASGIIGAGQSGYAFFKIHNCVNTGKITGASNNKAAAFNGWGADSGKGNSQVWNCYNLGELSPLDGNNTFFRGSFRSVQNCFDAVTTVYQSGVSAISAEDIANGRLCYLLNQGETEGISFKQTIGVDPYPMPVADGAVVYQVADLDCAGNPKGGVTYSNTNGGSRDSHNFDHGICSVCGASDETYVTLNADGYYHLTNAYEVEWFSVKVKEAKNAQIKAKLDNDIDFTGITHTPIGPNSGAKFFGEFDGQGHTISNLTMDGTNTAFFLWVRGGSTIKNLIIDSNCSFHAQDRAAAFVCVVQAALGGVINIEKCVNKANVSSESKVSAGFIAACNWENSDQPKVHFTNCWNAGNITQNGSDYAAAFFGWNKVGSPDPCMLTGCLNTGIISSVQNNQNLIRSENGNAQTINNCYDATPAGTQGVKTDWTTENPMTSGELCYYLNGDQSNIGWKQTIGTDAMPVLFGSSQQVYVQGNVNCLNNPVGNVTYVNTNGNTNYLGHNFNAESGMCDYCGTPDTNFKTLINGAYELGNHYDLTWFAAMVNTGNPTINGRLTADIDMSEVTYTPIGNNDNKYHGTFDGNGHKVKLNIDANAYGQGFISIATGGTTVKNLVVTGKVKNAGSKTAGIIAEAIGGGTITIQNCGNEAKIEGAGGEVAAIVANNWGYQCTLNLENVYNIGDVSGTGDVSTICACQGNSSSVFKNVYNAGSVTGAKDGNFVRSYSGNGTYTNCYSTTLSNDNASIISTNTSAVESGELCAKLGFGFRQNLSSDTYPNFASDHGFVAQIGAAGYSTMYNVYSDVTIPSGIEAYAGVVNGESLSLVAIENKIAASEPVVLKLAEGTDAGLFNFMPTTGATSAASNSLSGSDGSVTGGNNIFALAQKGEPAKVGFYPVGNGVKIPAGKAYLQYTGGNAVKGFTFVFDEDDATGIQGVQGVQEVQGAIYNIAGQRINKMQRGINIVNGKKIAVK